MNGCPNVATVEVRPAQASDPHCETQVCDEHIADPGLSHLTGDAPPSHYEVRVLGPDERGGHCCAMNFALDATRDGAAPAAVRSADAAGAGTDFLDTIFRGGGA